MSNRLRLPLSCTLAEYNAATPEQQKDYDRRLLAKWEANAARLEDRELQADYDAARDKQDWWVDVATPRQSYGM